MPTSILYGVYVYEYVGIFHVWPDKRLPRITVVFVFFYVFSTHVGTSPADAGAALLLHVGNMYFCAALLFVVLFYCCSVGPVTAVTTYGFFFEVACCRLLSA